MVLIRAVLGSKAGAEKGYTGPGSGEGAEIGGAAAAGTAVTAEDIEAWEKKAGLKVSAGDVILLQSDVPQWGVGGRLGPDFDGAVETAGRRRSRLRSCNYPIVLAREIVGVDAAGN